MLLFKYLVFLFFVTVSFQCTEAQKEKSDSPPIHTISESADYTLHQVENSKAVLILFGGYGQGPADIQRDFNILTPAKEKNISVVLVNINSTLWLYESDLVKLDSIFADIFGTNPLPVDNLYIGGYSSGGNIALLYSQHLIKSKKAYKPKGVFIVDSPIDLVALYASAQKNIEQNFSDVSIQEGAFILKLFNNTLGNPKDSLSNFEKKAVFTSKTNYIENVDALKHIKIRFYTEPDTNWWMENRRANYDQMNAYYIKLLAETLQKQDYKSVEYIPTKNKGYRSNGDRHPHSWSIVDVPDLITWMLDQ